MIGLVILATGCCGGLVGLVFGFNAGWERGFSAGVQRAVKGNQAGLPPLSVTPRQGGTMMTPIKGPEEVFTYGDPRPVRHRHHSMESCTDDCYRTD